MTMLPRLRYAQLLVPLHCHCQGAPQLLLQSRAQDVNGEVAADAVTGADLDDCDCKQGEGCSQR